MFKIKKKTLAGRNQYISDISIQLFGHGSLLNTIVASKWFFIYTYVENKKTTSQIFDLWRVVPNRFLIYSTIWKRNSFAAQWNICFRTWSLLKTVVASRWFFIFTYVENQKTISQIFDLWRAEPNRFLIYSIKHSDMMLFSNMETKFISCSICSKISCKRLLSSVQFFFKWSYNCYRIFVMQTIYICLIPYLAILIWKLKSWYRNDSK